MSSAHWGTFTKDLKWNYSYQAASWAMRQQGFAEWGNWDFPGVSGGVIGAKGDAVVQVTYAAEHDYRKVAYVVTGVSDDSALAESARNTVRSDIVRFHPID